MNVELRPIPGYPNYAADKRGEIWVIASKANRHINRLPYQRKKQWHSISKRWQMGLNTDGKMSMHNVSRLICLAFHGLPPTPQHQACHRNGIATADRPSNLYWGTHQQNAADAVRDGNQKGELNGRAKLTKRNIRAIRKQAASGINISELSRRFSISRSNIRFILNGKTWSHIK